MFGLDWNLYLYSASMVQVMDTLQGNQISKSIVQKLFTPGPICYPVVRYLILLWLELLHCEFKEQTVFWMCEKLLCIHLNNFQRIFAVHWVWVLHGTWGAGFGGLSQSLKHELRSGDLQERQNKKNSYFSPTISNFLLQAGCLYFCLLTKEWNIYKKIAGTSLLGLIYINGKTPQVYISSPSYP